MYVCVIVVAPGFLVFNSWLQVSLAWFHVNSTQFIPIKHQVSTHSDFAKTYLAISRDIFVVTVKSLLLASSGQRPGRLLNILECKQHIAQKNQLAQMTIVPNIRNPSLRLLLAIFYEKHTENKPPSSPYLLIYINVLVRVNCVTNYKICIPVKVLPT